MLARETKPLHRLALLSLLILITLKTAVEIWSVYLIAVPRMGRPTALWIKCAAVLGARLTGSALPVRAIGLAEPCDRPEMIAAETNVVIALVVQSVFTDRIHTLYAARPRLARGIAGALVTLSLIGFALGTVLIVYTIAFISHGDEFSSTIVAYKWRCACPDRAAS